jgi:hypothetical protein
MNGTMPNWLAKWLGIPAGSASEGAIWQLDSAWHWAPWATLLLVLAAVFSIAVLYTRESTTAGRAYRAVLSILRLAAIALVLIMIAQWAIAVRLTGPPSIAVIIDHSASMSIADPYTASELPATVRERLAAAKLDEPTRLNLAKLVLTEDDGKLLNELAGRYRLHVYFVAADTRKPPDEVTIADLAKATRALSAEGYGSDTTRLGDAVRQVLQDFRGAPPSAIVVYTDGVVTAGTPLGDAAEDARRAGVPIIAIGLGSIAQPRDLEIADVLVDNAVFVNDLVSLQIQIRSTGLEGQSAQVALRREGDSTPLATESVTLPPSGQAINLNLSDRPTAAGDVTYVVEATLPAEETSSQNNRQSRTVAVRDERIRVLLAQAYPSYEFRFVKTLLERDATIELSTYLQDADPDYAEQDKTALRTLPSSRDELFEYDVLFLGDIDPRLVPRSFWQHLSAFVAEKGGGVAFIAGPRFLPWMFADNSDVAALLPIEVSEAPATATLPDSVSRGFTVVPTNLGLQSPSFQLGNTAADTRRIWRDLAPLYWLYEASDLKPAVQVLAKGADHPVICFQYVGPGRVLFHAIDSTWRWREGAGDIYFARYWVQTIRFLARSKLSAGRGVQLTTNRRQYTAGEPVELRARFLDMRLAPSGDEVVAIVEAPGQARRRVTLGRNLAANAVFSAALSDLPPGQYDVALAEPAIPGGSASVRFTVTIPPGEFANPIMDAAALTAAATTTRGKFYTIANTDSLLADLPKGRRVPIENLPPIPLWNRWWLLAAFVAFLTAEWVLRKRKGML